MSWLLPRLLATLLCVVLGGVLGYLAAGGELGPATAALLGASLVVGIAVAIDTLRGYRLIRWLRGSLQQQAPRGADLWGELGYRVERNVRALEKQVAQERRSLEQFLSAIEASPNGVILLDDANQIDWCNAVAADQFGLDPKRDIHQPITNLVRSPAFVAYMQRGRFDEPVRFAAPHGDVMLSVRARGYGEGLKIVLSQDITARERADAMRRDFVANVSHEIRTPLTVLTGFIETMSKLSLSEEERSRLIELMSQQARRMNMLVADLLILARLEGSPRPAAQQWVPLDPLMQQTEVEARELSAGRHQIVFAGPAAMELAGAQSELASAVSNLVGNAVRYTPDGGRVDVGWRVRADGVGEITVADDGPGIAREHLPRLTERFYRVDSSRSRDTGGTGLGLSIVKHVAQRHGGELDVQSTLGKGSSFRLSFPAARTRLLGAQTTSPLAERAIRPVARAAPAEGGAPP